MTTYETLLSTVRRHNPAFAVQHAKENEQAFLRRFLTEIASVPDDMFESMPENVQIWFNHAVTEELNAQRPVTAPEGMQPPAPEAPPKIQRARPIINGSGDPAQAAAQEAQAAPAPQPQAPAQPEPTQPVPHPEPTQPAPHEPTPAPSAAPQAAPAQEVPRKRRAAREEPAPKLRKQRVRKAFSMRSVRKMVVENPNLTIDDLWDACERAGEDYTRSTIVLARGQALEMMDIVKETGHWRD